MASRPLDLSVMVDGMCGLTSTAKPLFGIDNMPLPPGDISCSSCSVTTPISIVLVRQKDFLSLLRSKKGAEATTALGSCGQTARIKATTWSRK
jgi:hypothetical protein